MRKPGYQLDEDDREAVAEFEAKVNMSSRELDAWLASTAAAGDRLGEDQYEASRRMVSILGKRRVDYTIGDIAYMRKAVGYINRHLAQRPPPGAGRDGWRQELMRWGHDPDKAGGLGS